MSNPTKQLLSRSGDAVVDALTNGTYWLLDSNRTIQWSIANGFEGERWNDASLTAQYLQLALSNVSYYANVRFQYVGFHANPDAAFKAGSDITLSLSGNREVFPSTSIWARAGFPFTPWETFYAGQSGDMFLNVRSQANFLPSYDPGSSGFSLLLHELGHALGLKHTHDDGGTGRPTLANIGLQQFDQDFASVMSYRDEFGFDLVRYDPATFMIFDVLALQALYGKNTSTNAGNTHFELSTLNLYGTIWDASGTDTVDASAATSGWTVVLPSIRPSVLVPEAIGYALPTSDLSRSAPTTLIWMEGDIENATGSRFSDTLIGNGLRNSLRGGPGDDFIDGGSGTDTAVFSVARGAAAITRQGLNITVQSAEGADTLNNVERLLFSDQLLAFDLAGNAGMGYRLYQAAFARTPDRSGLSFWIDKLDDGAGLRDVAAGFISSPEFINTYRGAVTPTQYVSQFYKNVLGRDGEAGGVSFWSNELARGVALADVLVGFSESGENQNRLASIIGVGIQLDPFAFV